MKICHYWFHIDNNIFIRVKKIWVIYYALESHALLILFVGIMNDH